MKVWKATHMRSNGTWCIPKGEEIMVIKEKFHFKVLMFMLELKTLIVF